MQGLDPARLPSQQHRTAPRDLPLHTVKTPADLLDLRLLEGNLLYLSQLAEALDVQILLAQKAFSLYASYPLIGRYLAGTTASGLYEARLAYEAMPGKAVHVFSAGYGAAEIKALLDFADCLIFNSLEQLLRFQDQVLEARETQGRAIAIGLRVNHEHQTASHPLYDPAGPSSRLGVRPKTLKDATSRCPDILKHVDGFHFHSLCEQNAADLASSLQAFERGFGDFLEGRSWLNLGGGHHLTRADYELPVLQAALDDFRSRHPLQLILEPGEAVALDCGFLLGEVLDLVHADQDIAILNLSAACHMPDVLEVPYTPRAFLVLGAGEYEAAQASGHPVRLAGASCLAGDVIGNYHFSRPLRIGDRLAFGDMAIYSHVKRNHFNGMPLPDLYAYDGKALQLLRRFGYQDFKGALGS